MNLFDYSMFVDYILLIKLLVVSILLEHYHKYHQKKILLHV